MLQNIFNFVCIIKNQFMLNRFAFFVLLLFTTTLFGQNSAPEESAKINLPTEKKKLNAVYSNEAISIDGELNEAIWQKAETATHFFMYDPDNGKPISENKKSDVKIVYDNEAIYIGAILNDENPSKIMREITARDDDGSSDFFGVSLNGYNDGQQEFRFFVTAAGVQLDCNANDQTGEDFSWDAVWHSDVKITNTGWTVEMKIPYAALRFSKESVQTWGVNFLRQIRRDRQLYTWSNVDNKIGAFAKQSGELHGIQDIKVPTRLFLLPYASYYVNADATQKTKGTAKGGLDIKYGINSAFTLDMILVPDFGQAAVDQKILNLGPFEQQFNENRAFFTEGTDLFSKGNLLYTRRIGGNATYELAPDETYLENPSNVGLINAFKISGRTKSGLGIGVLNAVTERTSADIQNTTTNKITNKVIEPIANYNVLVFDQRFRKNSSISFINTNVTRDGNFRDANVSALVWDLKTKANTYGIQGNFKYSYVNDLQIKQGASSYLEFNKISGKYRYGAGGEMTTKKYDNNDLGINFETNFHSLYGNASYRIVQPIKHFNSFNTFLGIYTQFHNETGRLLANNINLNINATNKKNNSFGIGLDVNPLQNHDYYEPRVQNRYVLFPSKIGIFGYFSSNYNKKFALDLQPSCAKLNETGRDSYGITIAPRYRFNDKFSLNYNFFFFRQNNNKGYYDDGDYDANPLTPNTIVFTNRNVVTYSNTLSAKYALNSKMTLNLSVRQYWSYSENKNFLTLQDDGTLKNYAEITPITNYNRNLNSWNLDLAYSWWFAPGSQVSVLYRNNAFNYETNINKDFGKNTNNLLNNDALSHVLSVSVKYFIDYNQAKHWL